MTEALLVTDQTLDIIHLEPHSDFAPKAVLAQAGAEVAERCSALLWDLPRSGQQPFQLSYTEWSLPSRQPAVSRTRVSVHRAIERLAQMRKARQASGQFDDEMDWIAKNRHRFSGQWVALQGRVLVAAGTTAREVADAAKNRSPNPLIVYLEPDERPFAGW